MIGSLFDKGCKLRTSETNSLINKSKDTKTVDPQGRGGLISFKRCYFPYTHAGNV